MKDSSQDDKRRRNKRHVCAGEHPIGDRGQIIFLFVFLVIWGLDSFILRWTTMLAAVVPLPVRLGLAGLIFILAGYFVQTGHQLIADPSFSDKGLKKDGPFARLRHPLYGGTILFYLSLVLSTLSLAAFAVWCGIAVFYNFIAAYEERLLVEKYGDEYHAYKQKVSRWV